MRRSTFVAGFTGAVCALGFPRIAGAQLPLDDRLQEAIEGIPGSVGVYAHTMAFGAPVFAYNADVSFPSASTIKMLIMLTAFKAAEHDPSVMRERITFTSDDLIGGSDYLVNASDGQQFTVAQLIVPMITLSDNTASNLLISHFGFERINAVTAAAGLHHTYLKRHFLDTAAILRHMDNRTTPADMGHLLFELERAVREEIPTVASPRSCRKMIDIMLGQTDHDTIPRGLPPGVPVANKTGELSRSRSDVAIVDPYGDSPYVLAVYTNKLDAPQDAYDGIARISHLIYGKIAGSDL